MSRLQQTVKLQPRLPTDDEIIAFCEAQRDLTPSKTFPYPSRDAIAFIKCGSRQFGMMAEMLNQDFAFKALESMPHQKRAGIRVPEIYRVIERDSTVYIVMEYVNGRTLKELLEEGMSHDRLQYYYNQIAKAIKLFISMKVPDGATPGPVGGGTIKHPLFKDTMASIEYASFDDLQQHVNNVANLPETNDLTIDFRGEHICFCFADLYEGNFIFTDKDLYILDFEHAGFLPVSFMTYAFDQPRPVCKAIKEKFDLPDTNLSAMKVAGHNFLVRWRNAGLPLNETAEKKFTADVARNAGAEGLGFVII